MATLSPSQIAQVAREAGLPESKIPTAVAIALAESSGRTNAHNPNRLTGDNSYGLWQINMLDKMGPERRKRFGISSNEELFNPLVNAKAMVAMSNGGTNWRPWSTYNTGAHLIYMGQGRKAAGTKGTATQAGWWDDFKEGLGEGWDFGPGIEDFWDGGTENDPSLTEGLTPSDSGIWAIGTLMTSLGKELTDPDNWRNWLYIGIGGALVIGGLIVVTKPAVSGVANAAPTKRVVGALKAKRAAKQKESEETGTEE